MAKPFDATLNTLIDAHLSDWVGAEVYQNMSLTLEDSTTYQLILERGEAKGIAKGKVEGLAEGKAEGVSVGRSEEAQALVLRLGTKRFGPPPTEVEVAVRAITDRERLERIAERTLDATNWADLLATP